jgi:hypothetical protein
MKKWILLLLLTVAPLAAQTICPTLTPVTPNIGLYVPAIGTPYWGYCVNTNTSKLDAFLSGVTPVPNFSITGALTVGNQATFNNITINGTCTGAGCGGGGGGGGSPPGGVNLNVQYNNAGVFGGAPGVNVDVTGTILNATGGLTTGTLPPTGSCPPGLSGAICLTQSTTYATPAAGIGIIQADGVNNAFLVSGGEPLHTLPTTPVSPLAVDPQGNLTVGIASNTANGVATCDGTTILCNNGIMTAANTGNGTVANCSVTNALAYYAAGGSVVSCNIRSFFDASGNLSIDGTMRVGRTQTNAGGIAMKTGSDNGVIPNAIVFQAQSGVQDSGYALTWSQNEPPGTLRPLVITSQPATHNWIVAAQNLSIAGGGTGQNTAATAFTALAPTATRAGDIIYWDGAIWNHLAGNNSGTQFLQETNVGVPSWNTVSGTGTVTSVAQTVPTGFAIAGSPVTTSGTLAITTTGLTTNVLQKAVSGGIADSTVTDNGTTVSTTEPMISQSYNRCTDSSGSGSAQVCNTTPTFTVVDGSCIIYKTTTANTGASLTLNVNSLGAKPVAKWQGTTTLAANDVLVNKEVLTCYDGTNWELHTIGNPPPAGAVASFSGDGTIITNSVSTGAVTTTIAGTSGGIPYFSSSSGWASSGALTHFGVVFGGGAAGSPTSSAQGALNMPLIGQGASNPIFSTIAYPTSSATGGLAYGSSTTAFAISSALTGIVRGGNPPTAAELSGDATTSGSNAVSVVKVNGGSIPASAHLTGTNSSNQFVASTAHDVAVPLACADVSASGSAQSCTTSPSFTPAAGDCVIYTTTTANTGTGLTLNVNALGAKSVAKWQGTTTLAANDVLANKEVLTCYDGTNWELHTIGNAPSGGGGVTNVGTNSPLSGGPITTTGTISCATCVTSAAALTSNQAVNGNGSQTTVTGFSDTAGTITSGHLACYTATNQIGNCTGTPSNNIIGVFNSSTTWIASGETSVTLDATVNVTFGDILCASSSAGVAHDNAGVSCTSGEWVGIVKTTASSVSAATAFVALR